MSASFPERPHYLQQAYHRRSERHCDGRRHGTFHGLRWVRRGAGPSNPVSTLIVSQNPLSKTRTDIILASDQAKFALPEVKVGLSAGAGGTANLHRLIGYHNAMSIILTGRHISAQEMKEFRFVQEVVPHAKIVDRALEWAEMITANSPDGVRASKAQARHGREVGWVQANLDTNILPEVSEMRWLRSCGSDCVYGDLFVDTNLDSSDRSEIFTPFLSRHFQSIAMREGANFIEGPLAFAQKRKPNWKPPHPLPKAKM